MDTKRFTIYFTSDLHGYIYPTDYRSRQERNIGLFKCASQFHKDGNTLVIDGGDILQGSPLGAYCHDTLGDASRFAGIMNRCGYDYVTLGNHDFNYGMDYLDSYLNALHARCVCENVRWDGARVRFPARIHTLENGLRIGIVGIVTDYVNIWEKPEHLSGITISDPIPAARAALESLRGRVDVTLCIYHGGFERDLATGRVLSTTHENVAYRLCQELDFDLLLTGHQHMTVHGQTLCGTFVVQPTDRGQEFLHIEAAISETGKRFTSETIPASGACRREWLDEFAGMERGAQDWLDQVVGHLPQPLMPDTPLHMAAGGSGLPDLFNAVQLWASGAQLSASSLANDAAGNNNRKLYVGDNNGLERSAIVLYGADFAMANDPVTKYPAGRKVTLNLENAKYYAFNNVRQLTDVVVTVGDEEVELVVPSLSVEKFNTGDYQAQYVKLNNMTPAQSFVGKPWTATESQSVTLNDASGKTLTVYMNKAQFATGFADMYVADKTGTIYGVAETYRENAQLIPTKKADIAALSTDQGGGTDPDPTPGDAIYYESFGTADVSDKPLIADYTGWAKTGSGAGEVSYTGEGNMSIRTSGKLSAGYDGASGKNKAFFGTNNPALIINKIKLDGAQDLQLTFGAQYSKTIDYDAGLYDNEFKPEKFHLALSADGTSWTTVEYTYAQADEFWVFATSKFKLKNKAAYLYVKYAVDEASVFAIDDVTLAEGEGGTDPEPADPAHIVLDFSVGASIFTPALPDKEAQSKTGSYLFDGNYAFNISASNIFYWFQNPYEDSPGYGTKSLFIGKAGSYIELPAIADKALTKVIISAAKGAGAYSIAITDAAGTPVQGGQAQEVTKQEGGEYTYTLSNTANATAYRIAVTTAGNAQLAKIELFYGEGGGSTPVQPTLSVNPTSLSFAAKDQAKTIACTVANADGYTVGASSSDPANFAASAAGTTVTVTPTENTGSARNATVTVYLTNDGGATKVAAKTVAVTQAAAGGSEPAGDTYDKITKVAELVNGMTGFIGCEPGGTYGLQLVTGFAAYGQGFTAAYTYDETKKTLSLTSGNYTAIEFTFEAVADGFNIKQGDKYLIGTGIIDNGKPKQGLVLADAPAQPWTFTEDASGVIATTSASGTVDGQAFNYPAIYMMCANSASSRFLRPYVQASYGKGFCFFKKN